MQIWVFDEESKNVEYSEFLLASQDEFEFETLETTVVL